MLTWQPRLKRGVHRDSWGKVRQVHSVAGNLVPGKRGAAASGLGVSRYRLSVLNIHARGFFTKGVAPLALALNRAGITPNAITVFGTIGAVTSALICFTTGWFFTGGMLVWGFVMLDLVDGVMARSA